MADVSSVTKHFITGQEGFTTTLASTISSGASTVPLNSVSGYTNGEQVAFVIEPTDASKKQVFTGTIDTSGVQVTGVVWTEGTNQTHSAGVTVVDYWTATHQAAMVKGTLVEHNQDGTHDETLITSRTEDTSPDPDADFVLTYDTSATALKKAKISNLNSSATGWINDSLPAVSSVTNNGNGSYTVPFASAVDTILSPGMKLKFTRTVAASTQCADLEASSSQYFNDTSVSGMTFTDDFCAGAIIKADSYGNMSIISRFNGTSGFDFQLDSSGRVALIGYNAGGGNFSYVRSAQSVPLGRWVKIAAQLDMSAFTATTTTSYVMIESVDVPATVTRAGTNPTALVQAGNLEVGSRNGGTLPFDGKISNSFISSAKITQANMRILQSRDLTAADCSTYGLVSAHTLNNSLTDLNTTNANNLTAQNGALATNADSPFANATGTPTGTTDVALVMAVSGSSVTVQVPEGCTIPATGGITSVSYSTSGSPYGWTADKGKWEVLMLNRTLPAQVPVSGTWYNLLNQQLNIPVGSFTVSFDTTAQLNSTGAPALEVFSTLSTSPSSETDKDFTANVAVAATAATASTAGGQTRRTKSLTLSATTIYYLLNKGTGSALSNIYTRGDNGSTKISAIPAGI